MPNPALTDEQCQAAVDAEAAFDTKAEAAAAIGLRAGSFYNRLMQAKARGITARVRPEIELPQFPDDDLDATEILDHMAARFQKRIEHHSSLKWFEIKVNHSDPIGIAWFGDPHLGNNGCNVPLLQRDVEIVQTTPGLYGANIGDTVDNWSGRLVHLYSENDVSRKTERRLARWFLEAVPWLVWIEGNHDTMDAAFTAHLRAVNAHRVAMLDWRAQFVLTFRNKAQFRIDAAHNHKGHSMYHELHGQLRAALNETADLYIAGHHHNWALMQRETERGVMTLARCRGYKFVDSYADHHQYHNHQHGAAIVTVFDPRAKTATLRLRAFPDIEEGAEYLTWLRQKAKAA